MKLVQSLLPYIDKEYFAKELNSAPRVKALFDLIRFDLAKDNKEASNMLLGPRGSKEAFKQIRLRLRQRLLDFILKHGAQFKNVDEYSQRYRECMNVLAVARFLKMNSNKETAIEMEEQLIKKTLKYEYTDLSLLLARDIYHFYSEYRYESKKAHKYDKVLRDVRTLYDMELNATQFYCELCGAIAESHGVLKHDVLVKAKCYANVVNDYLKVKATSYQLLVLIYQILILRYELSKEYDKLLDVCDRAINEFEQRKVNRKLIIFHFNLHKIRSYIYLGQYSKVDHIATYYLQIMTEGTLNWYGLKMYLVINKLYSREYQLAYDVQREIRKVDLKNHDRLLQAWTIYEAHIEFLIAIGKIKTDQPSKFRLHKFLNEIPLYTKDKKGLNIAILIIHVLFLLHQRKYSQIIDRTEALQLYCYRYLRKDDTFRSHCFIKMLLQMPRADFNRIRTERYAQPFVTKLRSMPLMISGQTIEVEIIPYEDLWKMTLDLLD